MYTIHQDKYRKLILRVANNCDFIHYNLIGNCLVHACSMQYVVVPVLSLLILLPCYCYTFDDCTYAMFPEYCNMPDDKPVYICYVR